MDSAFIHQAANELVQTAGTRNIKQIARSCSLDIMDRVVHDDMVCIIDWLQLLNSRSEAATNSGCHDK